MTARPGRIKEIVEITRADGPGPEFANTAEYARQVDHLWRLVRDEAILAQATRE
jgi:hypothetical protein